MRSLADFLLFFAGGFAISIGVGWLYVALAKRSRSRNDPHIGVVVRIRASSGMYRAQLLKVGSSVFTLSAPIQRDRYIPLRVGEEVIVEAPGPSGALLFRSEIVSREKETHQITIRRPDRIHRVERREHRRWPELAGARVRVEGESAKLLDIAEGGARLQTSYRTHKGDRVKVQLPWGETVYAWVLAAEPGEARLRFEELVRARPAKKETAPAV